MDWLAKSGPSSQLRLSAIGFACVVALLPAPTMAQPAATDIDEARARSEFQFRDRRATAAFVRAPALSRTFLAPTLAADPAALDSVVRHISVAGAGGHLHARILAAAPAPNANSETLATIVARVERLLRDRHYTNGLVMFATFKRDRENPELIRVSIEQPTLGGVEIVNAPENIRAYLRRLGDRMEDEGPLTEERLERYLILFNRVPGCRTRLDVREASPAGGASEIMVRVDYDRISARAELNNRAPLGIGREIISNTLIVNDVAAGADFLDIRARTNITPGSALILDATYGVNLHPEGLILELSGFASSIRPDPLQTGGDQYEIGIRYFGAELIRPLRLRKRSQAYLSVSASSGQFQFSANGLTLFDETRWLGSAAIEWTQQAFAGVTTAKASVNHGFAILGATRRGDPRATRGGEGAEFTFFVLEASREQTLTSWATLVADMYLQAATQSLLAPDSCVYGGRDYGRAFDNEALFGDNCFLASAELRLSPKALDFGAASLEPYFYADGGAMKQVGIPDPAQVVRAGRMSAGGGLRMALGKSVSAQIEFTQALRRSEPAGANRERGLYFQIGADF
jgi:hemolysin activation/secretion protein